MKEIKMSASKNKSKTATKVTKPVVEGKKLRGRPPGSNSTSLVSLATLVKSLPATAVLPIGSRFLRLVNIQPESSFVSNTSSLTEIAAKYKTQAVITDLNEKPVTE